MIDDEEEALVRRLQNQGAPPERVRRAAELAAAVRVNQERKAQRRQAAYAKMPVGETARIFSALKCPQAIVWLWLIHRASVQPTRTVSVPSAALRDLGVSRDVKQRALRQLERAGKIKVERRGRKNPVVTLI